jgi:superoxide reductase
MTTRGQIWKCPICGNIIEVLHEGADALVCCGKPMELMSENTSDGAGEKHVPVIEGRVVKVGSVAHPMEEAHYIEWIEATSFEGEVCRRYFKPGDVPEVEFGFDVKSAREYCNLHGLWKS